MGEPQHERRCGLMHILITGATNFIGLRLALRARELEHEVIATGLVRAAGK